MTIEEGYYNAVIGGVRVVDNRFGQDGKEIEIKVGLFDKDNKPLSTAEVYLEYSNRYGFGNMSQMKQWQIAESDLKKLGFEGGSDFTRLNELVNKSCRVRCVTKDKEGKPLSMPRFYLAFSEVKAVQGDVNSIMAAIRAGGSAPAPTPAPTAPGAAPTPPAAAPGASPFNFGGGAAPTAPAPAPTPSFPGFPA